MDTNVPKFRVRFFPHNLSTAVHHWTRDDSKFLREKWDRVMFMLMTTVSENGKQATSFLMHTSFVYAFM